jgi:GT2 family glycosyltransferase
MTPVETILVDNPSDRSDEIEKVAARFPQVRRIVPGRNLGFAGGMNAGIRRASGRYVLLVCDDIELHPQCVATLWRLVEARTDVAIVTGLLLKRRTGKIQSAGGVVRLGSIFSLGFRAQGQVDDGSLKAPFESDFAPGNFTLVRLDWLRRTGGFREDFFMYAEDVELGVRARKAGYRVLVEPRARAVDLEGPSYGESDRREAGKVRNLFALYTLHAEPTTLIAFLARYGGWGVIRHLAIGGTEGRVFFRGLGRYVWQFPGLLRDRWSPSTRTVPLSRVEIDSPA